MATNIRITVTLFLSAALMNGCANMNQTEQRVTSGAAVGAVVGGPIGAAAGAGVGYAVDRYKKR